MSLHIADRLIGPEEPTFVIAEIGVNHDGSIERAMELVDAAASCGADAVKLQIFRADALMHRSSEFAAYQEPQCEEADPAAMLRRYELGEEAVGQVVRAIADCGMVPLATPFSLGDVETIEKLRLPAVKIASPDLVNRPLLAKAARLGKPLLISTGAATIAEVDETAGWLASAGVPFALLHCVSSYPTRNGDAHLGWIGEMSRRYEGVPIGYSDHTTEAMAGALAVAAGACIVEKHLTYDRRAAGPDHAASADPAEFAEYVRLLRTAEHLRGKGGKRVLEVERDVRRVSRQSLVLARALRAGEALGDEDVIVQRPGTGIPAAEAERVMGKIVARPLAAGTLLQWDMLCDAA
jgi:sialic acid synthase SpsE